MSRDIFLPESSAGVRTQACEIPAQTSSKPGQTERVLLADEFISLREKSGAIGKSNNLYRDRLRDFCCGPNGTLTRTYLVHLLISFTFELQIACSSRKAVHKAISCLDFTSRSQLCYSNTAAAFLEGGHRAIQDERKYLKCHIRDSLRRRVERETKSFTSKQTCRLICSPPTLTLTYEL